MEDKIFIIPVEDNKPVKIVCENSKEFEIDDKNNLIIKEKISIE